MPEQPMAQADLLCFSHLKWEFVFQRPQHLMSRAARTRRVFFFQEPEWTYPAWGDGGVARLETEATERGVVVARPMLPHGIAWDAYDGVMRGLLDGLVAGFGIEAPVLWYYTPHALDYAGHLSGSMTVYDCMDELSAFKGADATLPMRERALMARCDLVFTGGQSLFEAKRQAHPRVHCFPSGVDTGHFAPSRGKMAEPADQAGVPHPRAGFFGVLDERLDLGLLEAVAALRPGVQFVMIGPVAKIEVSALPRRANIHYLGQKEYAALPSYVAHWGAALMPFALNEATRFISPTKTPEYLAAGLPVVSTPVRDVVRQYGGVAGVWIAGDAEAFAAGVDAALAASRAWIPAADELLAGMSWDATWGRMDALLGGAEVPVGVAAE